MIIVNKLEGATPLETLNRLRDVFPQYTSSILSYAGRLDPMASGLMLVLEGEENKNRESYLNLDKEYEFEILFGFSTDTHDILGKVTEIYTGDPPSIDEDTLKLFLGTREQRYPLFSSRTVRGVPLHEHARAGTIEDSEIPTKGITVSVIRKLGEYTVSGTEFLDNIERRIAFVQGDFRQEEILDMWRQNLLRAEKRIFLVLRCLAHVSSGTYIRILADEIGKKVGIPALAYSIKRTRVGTYALEDAINLS